MADPKKLPDDDEIIELTEIIEKGDVPGELDFLKSLGLEQEHGVEASASVESASPQLDAEDDIFAELDNADNDSNNPMSDLESIIGELDTTPSTSKQENLSGGTSGKQASSAVAAKLSDDDLFGDLADLEMSDATPSSVPPSASSDPLELVQTAPTLDSESLNEDELTKDALFSEILKQAKTSPETPFKRTSDIPLGVSVTTRQGGNSLSLFGGAQAIQTSVGEIRGKSATQALAKPISETDSLFDELLGLSEPQEEAPTMPPLEELREDLGPIEAPQPAQRPSPTVSQQIKSPEPAKLDDTDILSGLLEEPATVDSDLDSNIVDDLLDLPMEPSSIDTEEAIGALEPEIFEPEMPEPETLEPETTHLDAMPLEQPIQPNELDEIESLDLGDLDDAVGELKEELAAKASAPATPIAPVAPELPIEEPLAESNNELDEIESLDLGDLDDAVGELKEELAEKAATPTGPTELGLLSESLIEPKITAPTAEASAEKPRFDTPEFSAEITAQPEVTFETPEEEEDHSQLDALLDDVIAAAPPISRNAQTVRESEFDAGNLLNMLIGRMDKLESAIRAHQPTESGAALESIKEGTPLFEQLLSALENKLVLQQTSSFSPELMQNLQEAVTLKVEEQIMETLESRMDEILNAKLAGLSGEKDVDIEQISQYVKDALQVDLERSAAAAAAKVIKEEILAIFEEEHKA